MSSQSRNALHVVRLVLSARLQPLFPPLTPHNRAYSSSTTLQKDDPNPFDFLSTPHPHPTTASPSPLPCSFLEESPEEYNLVKSSLPLRQHAPHPIPWPTLFAPKINKYNRSRHLAKATKEYVPETHLCDGLHRIVISGDYIAARSVLEELQRSGYKPKARKSYLDPALACLYASTPDREGFLQWMALYPNRPALQSYKAIQTIWMPIVQHLRAHHTFETDFLRDFLVLAAKLGLLPVVFNPLITHMTLVAPPATSLAMFRDVIEAYYASTTSSQSNTKRALYQKAIVDEQVEGWWNRYVRRLAMVGYNNQAIHLFNMFEKDHWAVTWDQVTRQMIQNAVRPSKSTPVSRRTHSAPLPDRIRSALSCGITPKDLARIIEDLSLLEKSHPSLLARFKSRFILPPRSRSFHRRTAHPRARIWTQAEIIQLRNRQDHTGAIRLFLSRHIWIGLPDHPRMRKEIASIETDTAFTASHSIVPFPSIHVITTLLPSLFATLPDPRTGLIPFHKEYLQLLSSLPPALQPTEATHGTFVRAITAINGPTAGLEALDAICEKGMNPGEAACGAVIFSLASRGRIGELNALLDAMEEEKERNGVVLSRPTKMTYDSLMSILESRLGKEDLGEEGIRAAM